MTNLFKYTLGLLLAVASIMLSGCSRVTPGHVGVQIEQYGSGAGVQNTPLSPGAYLTGVGTSIEEFPTFTQSHVWTRDSSEGRDADESITFQTVEGLSVNADVGISYTIISEKAPHLYQKYRQGVDEITHGIMRTRVRDAFVQIASTKQVETIYGQGKSELLASVEKMVRDELKEDGIHVDKISYVGDLRLPPQIVAAINAKIAATQQAQQRENEVATAQAQAQIEVAKANGEAQAKLISAQAEAKSLDIVGEAISRNSKIVDLEAVKKWNGQLPQMMGNGAVPFINVSKQ